jgi:hypothetical protein
MDPSLTFSYALFMFQTLRNKIITEKSLGLLLLASLEYSKIKRRKTDATQYSGMQSNEGKCKLKWIVVLCASKRAACTKRIQQLQVDLPNRLRQGWCFEFYAEEAHFECWTGHLTNLTDIIPYCPSANARERHERLLSYPYPFTVTIIFVIPSYTISVVETTF